MKDDERYTDVFLRIVRSKQSHWRHTRGVATFGRCYKTLTYRYCDTEIIGMCQTFTNNVVKFIPCRAVPRIFKVGDKLFREPLNHNNKIHTKIYRMLTNFIFLTLTNQSYLNKCTKLYFQ